MTTTPTALQWLDTEFGKTTKRFARDFRAGPSSKNWHGPSYIRPMIQLRSVMDGGKAMRVCADDYNNPNRWWL